MAREPLVDPKESVAERRDEEGEKANSEATTGVAATNTVNERLLAELQEAANKEKYGARSKLSRRGLTSVFGTTAKTDEERRAAIEEARNLNGVNPIVTCLGGLFALASAAGLWTLTQWLAEYFAFHPVDVDAVYFVARVTQVFRNVAVGLVSLASGFFGVTGLGIFALGVRVAYGVAIGELDPTPIKKKQSDESEGAVDFGQVWDLMAGKTDKRGRR
jgi:Protein of unknown function (DUF3082)